MIAWAVVVYLTTLFALTAQVSNGYAAMVIVQAGVFAEASRQLVKYVGCLPLSTSLMVSTFPGFWHRSSWTSILSNVSASIWKYLKKHRPSSKGSGRPRIGHRLTPESSSRTCGSATLQHHLMYYAAYRSRSTQERILEWSAGLGVGRRHCARHS